jgi:hypothetical protein
VSNEFFLADDEARSVYLRLLGIGLRNSDWRCFSYGLMSSHIHLGTQAGETPLSDWLREPHNLFAEWINRKYKRIGGVFVRGPRDHRVEPQHILRLIGYIHTNPVRAGVVRSAEESTWTSAREYLGEAGPDWLDVELGLQLAGAPSGRALADWTNRAHASGELTRRGLVRPRGRPLSEKGSHPISNDV